MNEFVLDDVINLYINTMYQSNEQYIANQIKQYFNGFYSNKTLKKYYISIDVQDRELHIDFKWGCHAIVANNNNKGEPLD